VGARSSRLEINRLSPINDRALFSDIIADNRPTPAPAAVPAEMPPSRFGASAPVLLLLAEDRLWLEPGRVPDRMRQQHPHAAAARSVRERRTRLSIIRAINSRTARAINSLIAENPAGSANPGAAEGGRMSELFRGPRRDPRSR